MSLNKALLLVSLIAFSACAYFISIQFIIPDTLCLLGLIGYIWFEEVRPDEALTKRLDGEIKEKASTAETAALEARIAKLEHLVVKMSAGAMFS